MKTFSYVISNLSQVVSYLNELKGNVKTATTTVSDIVMYLCFGACVILIITSFVANDRGKDLGFSAEGWALKAGLAGAAVGLAKQIFGI